MPAGPPIGESVCREESPVIGVRGDDGEDGVPGTMLDKSDSEEVVIGVGVAEPFVVVGASSAATAVGVALEEEPSDEASKAGSVGSMPFWPTAAAGGDTTSAWVREEGAVVCEDTGLFPSIGGAVVGDGAGAGVLGFAADVGAAAAGGGAAILVAGMAFGVVVCAGAGACGGGDAIAVSTDAAAAAMVCAASSAAKVTTEDAGGAIRERVQRLPLKIVVESGGVAMQRTDS